MRKTEKIIGLPVIDLSTGNQIGKVWDIIINGEKGMADYLIIDDGFIILGAKIISAKDVQGIGEYAVTVKKKDVMLEMSKVQLAIELYKKNVRVKGTQVMTQKGRLIGEILDVYFDYDDCLISALEYGGFNNKKKTRIITRKEVVTFGEKLTVVVDELENMLEDDFDDAESDILQDGLENEGRIIIAEQNDLLYEDGSLKKTIAEVPEPIPQKQEPKERKRQKQPEIKIVEENLIEEIKIMDKDMEINESDSEPVKNDIVTGQPEQENAKFKDEEKIDEQSFKEGISAASYSYKPVFQPQMKHENKPKSINKSGAAKSSNLFEQKQKEFLIGRKITKTIKDSKGNHILSEGEVITEEAVDMAKDAGKLIEIVMNNKPLL